ncbi:MAG TPA: hypothetical protein VMW63_01710 [Methanoregulaceae archaeon]|nr:hypothetical protein [Methanoregulaceae archaeon]
MEWTEPSPEITEEVETMLRKHGIKAIREAGQRLKGAPASQLEESYIRQQVARSLSRYITYGLVQLSVEQVKATDEFRESLRDTSEPYTIVLHRLLPLSLPEYAPRISLALKAGATELWRADTAFAVRALMGLRETRITLQERKLKEFKFGSLKGAISVYLKKEQIEEILHSFNRDLTIPGMMGEEGK